MRRAGRGTVLLIAALCAAPFVAAYVAYYFWRPAASMNYGELIAPRALPEETLATLDGAPLQTAALKGKWLLLYAAPAGCDAACRQTIYYLRQVRSATGEKQFRVERVWLLADDAAPDAAWLRDYPGMRVLRGAGSRLAAALEAGRVYVADPRGRIFLRFPAQPDPARMLKDLERLLKYSSAG